MSPEDPILKQAGLNTARKLAEKYRSLDALSKVPMGDCQQGLSLLADLIGYIDDLERDRIAYRNLGSKIEELETTIEALKEKLVEQLAKYFVLQQAQCTFRTPIKGSMMSKCDKGVICDWNVCPIKDEWEERARQQLADDPKLNAAGVRWE